MTTSRKTLIFYKWEITAATSLDIGSLLALQALADLSTAWESSSKLQLE